MRLWIASIVLCSVACGHPPEDRSESFGASSQQKYPLYPESITTPGELCQKPVDKIYPEHIDFCDRNVKTETKKRVIRLYDERFAYSIGTMEREDFTIDHLIPVCMGGSNNQVNLWPQHHTVRTLTNPLEESLCIGMREGRIKQAEAVNMIQEVKHDHSAIGSIEEQVRSILN